VPPSAHGNDDEKKHLFKDAERMKLCFLAYYYSTGTEITKSFKLSDTAPGGAGIFQMEMESDLILRKA